MRYLIILFTYFVCLPISAGDIFVSPYGNDNGDGTKDAPLQTIQRALRMAREWRRQADARVDGGIKILLEGGKTFILDEPLYIRPEDSGTKDSPLTITSTSNSQAVISGQANWPDANSREAWLNGKRLWRAAQFPQGVMERMLDFNKDNETITIPAQSLRKFGIRSINDAPNLEMMVHQRWAIAILRVKDIRYDGDKAILSFKNPESRWEFSHPWPQPIIDGERGSSSYCLINAPQFLDEPDEYYGRLPEDAITPQLNRLVTIEGSQYNKVHDVHFQDITFSYTAWERPGRYGHVTLQGGFPIIDAYKLTEHEGTPWAKGLENQAWVVRPESAVSITRAERVNFQGCTFTHLGATALDYVSDCNDCDITRNMFTDIGGTALMCGSFGEGATEQHHPFDFTSCERFNIDTNVIHDCTVEDWGGVGIGCGYVRDFTIRNNAVSRVNYSGICIGWGWTPSDTGMRNNTIVGNHVSDFARQLYDAGGIYTMSNQPNSRIENNEVTAACNAPYATNLRAFAIYFDACTDGFTVEGNTLGTTPMLKEKYGYNNPGPSMIIEK